MVSEVSEVSAVLDSSRVVLCAGPGGVGKTTTSASLALGAAIAGKKVCVLTIDPARRLADALGLKLDNEPHQVDCGALAEEGLVVEGELWAMMLEQDAGDDADDWRRWWGRFERGRWGRGQRVEAC